MEVQVEIVATQDGRFRARATNLPDFETVGNSRDEALQRLTDELGSRLHMRVASVTHMYLYHCVDLEQTDRVGYWQVKVSPRFAAITPSTGGGLMSARADRYQPAVPLVMATGVLGGAIAAWVFASPIWFGFLAGFLTAAVLLAVLYAAAA